MLSLIWPYWQREAVTDRACALLAKHYADLDMELIIVDDGNALPYRPPEMPFKVTVVRLPRKSGPLNPCVPLNRGAAVAEGSILGFSCPDHLHTTPILQQMLDELGDDEQKYVLAAAWHAEKQVWHCHSTRNRPDDGDVGSMLPKGADYHFMSILHRALWEKTGGFDEDYRDGAGYDDPDFVLRLQRAGARFCMRDDLVVEHVRIGAQSGWTPAMFARNRQIFLNKWRGGREFKAA